MYTRILALAQAAAPQECLGLLFGSEPATASELWPLQNVAGQPERRYEAEPQALVRAVLNADQRGLSLVAIYHSHPDGPAEPSATDVALARWEVPYLILDPARREARAFLLLPSVREIALRVPS